MKSFLAEAALRWSRPMRLVFCGSLEILSPEEWAFVVANKNAQICTSSLASQPSHSDPAIIRHCRVHLSADHDSRSIILLCSSHMVTVFKAAASLCACASRASLSYNGSPVIGTGILSDLVGNAESAAFAIHDRHTRGLRLANLIWGWISTPVELLSGFRNELDLAIRVTAGIPGVPSLLLHETPIHDDNWDSVTHDDDLHITLHALTPLVPPHPDISPTVSFHHPDCPAAPCPAREGDTSPNPSTPCASSPTIWSASPSRSGSGTGLSDTRGPPPGAADEASSPTGGRGAGLGPLRRRRCRKPRDRPRPRRLLRSFPQCCQWPTCNSQGF